MAQDFTCNQAECEILSIGFERVYCVDLSLSYICMSFTTAGLRRSFRLRKDRQCSPGEPCTPDANNTEFLIYEEVTQYLPRPGERPRLIVLIGRLTEETIEYTGHFRKVVSLSCTRQDIYVLTSLTTISISFK